MIRKRTALAAAVLLAAFALPALADTSANNNEGIAALVRRPNLLIQVLKLTSSQADTLKSLISTLQTTVQTNEKANVTLDQQIKNALASPAPDNCALGKLVITRHQNELAIAAAFTKFDKDFSAILTPDQLKKWNRLKNGLGHVGGDKAAEAEED